MKSISLDSPDNNMEAENGQSGLKHRNMSVPKVVEQNSSGATYNSTIGDNSNNFGIGIGNRRYGAWANVVRNRMAAQQTNKMALEPQIVVPKRVALPPNSMKFGTTATSAPPSYNQCNNLPPVGSPNYHISNFMVIWP